MSTYEANRAMLPLGAWEPYDGQWVALTSDGSRILAGASTLEELDEKLSALGKTTEDVAFEKVDFENSCYLGGADLQ